VFIDETGTATKMARSRGRCLRGDRLVASVPHGHWKTMTLVAALRSDRIDAPMVIDKPMNGLIFTTWVEKVLAPTLRPGDIVIMDNLPAHKVMGVRHAIEAVGGKAALSAAILAGPQPDRTGLRETQGAPAKSGKAQSGRPVAGNRPRS
jgi:hypothetical protein